MYRPRSKAMKTTTDRLAPAPREGEGTVSVATSSTAALNGLRSLHVTPGDEVDADLVVATLHCTGGRRVVARDRPSATSTSLSRPPRCARVRCCCSTVSSQRRGSRPVLGYAWFGAAGGDIGGHVSRYLRLDFPRRLLGIPWA